MRCKATLKKLYNDESGVATLELALFSTVMMLFAIPVFDLAKTINDNLKVTASMRSGMYYAYRKPSDTSGIENALRNASTLDSAHLRVASSQYCECNGVLVECTSTCTGQDKATYMNLTVNYEVPLSLSYPQLGNAYVISKTSTLRVQ